MSQLILAESNYVGLFEFIIGIFKVIGVLIGMFFWVLFSPESPLSFKIVFWFMTIWGGTAVACWLGGEDGALFMFIILIILCIIAFL